MSNIITFLLLITAISIGISHLLKLIKTRLNIVFHHGIPVNLLTVHHWTEPIEKCLDLEVVGESNYQLDIGKIINSANLMAYLIPENNNPYDKNAVRIEINHLIVGYLDRDDAIQFRKLLKKRNLADNITSCKASITGGHKKNEVTLDYGIELDLSS
jgi:hypothetical protein